MSTTVLRLPPQIFPKDKNYFSHFFEKKAKKIIKQAEDYFLVILPFRHYSFVIGLKAPDPVALKFTKFKLATKNSLFFFVFFSRNCANFLCVTFLNNFFLFNNKANRPKIGV